MQATTATRFLTRERVIAATKAAAITIGFATAYVVMTVYSPVLAKSSFAGMAFGSTLRIANVLRAFSLVTPLAPIGTFFGSIAMDAGNPWGAALTPALNTAVGLGVWTISRRIGRSVAKDLCLLAIYGLLSALIVTFTNAGMAVLVSGAAFLPLVRSLIGFKVLTSMVIYMAGYPLVGAWEYASRRAR